MLHENGIEDPDCTLVTHKGTILLHAECLGELADRTSPEYPIVLEKCTVWINKEGTLSCQTYRWNDSLATLYDYTRSVILFEGDLLNRKKRIHKFKTTQNTPLVTKTISNYMTLPNNSPSGVYEVMHSSNTFAHLIQQLKDKYPDNDYKLTRSEHPVNDSVQLAVAFSPPFRGKYFVSVDTGYHYDFQFVSTSASASHANTKTKIDVYKKLKQYPLFADMYAMRLSRSTEDVDLTFAKKVQSIVGVDSFYDELRFPDKQLPEKSYTSILSSALDGFLGPEEHCCLHQCNLYNLTFPDFYVASMMHSGLPRYPKLIGDFKKKDMDDAEVQTFRYCLTMVNQTKSIYPLFAMPCTCETFRLLLCIPGREDKLAYIEIVKADVADVDELAQFFAIMKKGVVSLNPVSFPNNPITFTPLLGLSLNVVREINPRVFVADDRIWKFYKGDLSGAPNKQLIEHCLGDGYLPDMEVQSLADDDSLQMFSYRFIVSIEYTDRIDQLKCFRDIAKAIDDLHEKDIVHSDVRFQNMIFTKDCKGILIDFDLSGEVDVPYPDNYNDNLEERHPEAKCKQPRKKCHDNYSFLVTLHNNRISTIPEDYNWDGELKSLQVFQSLN